MAITQLGDVVEPEVFTDYMMERSIYKNALYRSSILTPQPQLDTLLDGGSSTFSFPFWQTNDVVGASPSAVNQADDVTPSELTADKMVARRLFFDVAFNQEDLASVLAGSNPQDAVMESIGNMWDRQTQQVLFAQIQGIIADDLTDDNDMINDITSAGNDKISSGAVIETATKFGDMQGDLVGIAMHSVPYGTLQEANLIDTRPENEQNVGWGTYLGKSVIVDDTLIDGSSDYWTVLFKSNAFGYGQTDRNYVPTELWRDPSKSGGRSLLYSRKVMAVHPYGMKYSETSESGTFPTLSDLKLAANWDRVAASVKNMRFVVLKSNG